MIQLENVTQHYGVRPVLRNIDLTISRGQLVAVIGPNGMGKSTLLGAMAGILSPQRGRVLIDGRQRRGSVDEEMEIRKRAVFLPDQPWLPKMATGREYVLAIGELYDVEINRRVEHAQSLLDLFNLTTVADAPIRSYSQGQKKKVAICGALVTEVDVYLLDEPFSGGLDPAGILALKRVLQRLAHDREITVVMTTPVAEFIDEIADRLIVIRDGVLAHDCTIDELKADSDNGQPLHEALQELVFPDTVESIERYFERLPA